MRFGRAPAASSAAQDCCIRRRLQKSAGGRTATPSRRGDSGRRSVGRSSSERRGDVVLAQPQRRGAQQAAIVAPSRPGSAEQQSALPTPRCCSRPKLSGAPALTAPPARRSRCRRAIVPTAASRRCLCHVGSRPQLTGPDERNGSGAATRRRRGRVTRAVRHRQRVSVTWTSEPWLLPSRLGARTWLERCLRLPRLRPARASSRRTISVVMAAIGRAWRARFPRFRQHSRICV